MWRSITISNPWITMCTLWPEMQQSLIHTFRSTEVRWVYDEKERRLISDQRPAPNLATPSTSFITSVKLQARWCFLLIPPFAVGTVASWSSELLPDALSRGVLSIESTLFCSLPWDISDILVKHCFSLSSSETICKETPKQEMPHFKYFC